MQGSRAERRPALTLVRLLVGSLIGGAGIALLALVFGGSPASAAEPAPSTPPAHAVLGAVGALGSSVDGSLHRVAGLVGGTVSATGRPVAQAVPAPAEQTVAPVAERAPDAVAGVIASAPASGAVAPVTGTVDATVSAVPLAPEILRSDPVRTAVTPAADAVDRVVWSIAGLTVGAVVPILGPPAPGAPGLPDARPVTFLPAAPRHGATGAKAVGDPSPAVTDLWTGHGHPDAARGSTAGAAPPAPPGHPDGMPLGQPEGTASGASTSGPAAGAPATALAGNDFALAAVAAGDNAPLTSDRLPSSPVADHDSSPD